MKNDTVRFISTHLSGAIGVGIIAMVLLAISFMAFGQPVDRTAKVAWSACATDIEGNPLSGAVTYNVFSGPRAGTKTKVASDISVLTRTFSGLPLGETCYQISCKTAVNEESDLSLEGCKSFAFPRASRPTAPTVE